MIINQTVEQTITSSNFQTQAMSVKIDERTFNLILNNLYNDPVSSIIRELSANAVDAHKLANTTESFLIQLPTTLNTNFIIRDFGTGLDEEEINKYLNCLFESGKLESNDFAGGFGLGSKSPFAILDSFNLESVKDGIKYFCLWYREPSGRPVLNVFNKIETQEKNGIKITLPLSAKYVRDFNEKINVIANFNIKPIFVYDINKEAIADNVDRRNTDNLNNLIKVKDTFKDIKFVDSFRIGNESYSDFYVDIAGVLYPFNTYSTVAKGIQSYFINHSTYKEIYRSFVNCFKLILTVPIGTLNLPLNRETIEDNEHNNTYILDKFKTSIREYLEHKLKDYYADIKVLSDKSLKEVCYKDYLELITKYPNYYTPNNFKTSLLTVDSDIFIKNTSNYKKTDLTSLLQTTTHKDLFDINTTRIDIIKYFLLNLPLVPHHGYNRVEYLKLDNLCSLFSIKRYELDYGDKFTYHSDLISGNYINNPFGSTTLFIVLDNAVKHNTQRIKNYMKNNLNIGVIYLVDNLHNCPILNANFKNYLLYFKNYLNLDFEVIKHSDLPKVSRVKSVSVVSDIDYIQSIRTITSRTYNLSIKDAYTTGNKISYQKNASGEYLKKFSLDYIDDQTINTYWIFNEDTDEELFKLCNRSLPLDNLKLLIVKGSKYQEIIKVFENTQNCTFYTPDLSYMLFHNSKEFLLFNLCLQFLDSAGRSLSKDFDFSMRDNEININFISEYIFDYYLNNNPQYKKVINGTVLQLLQDYINNIDLKQYKYRLYNNSSINSFMTLHTLFVPKEFKFLYALYSKEYGYFERTLKSKNKDYLNSFKTNQSQTYLDINNLIVKNNISIILTYGSAGLRYKILNQLQTILNTL